MDPAEHPRYYRTVLVVMFAILAEVALGTLVLAGLPETTAVNLAWVVAVTAGAQAAKSGAQRVAEAMSG